MIGVKQLMMSIKHLLRAVDKTFLPRNRSKLKPVCQLQPFKPHIRKTPCEETPRYVKFVVIRAQ